MALFTLPEISLPDITRKQDYIKIMSDTRLHRDLSNRISTYGIPVLRDSPPDTAAGDKLIQYFDWVLRADANDSITLRIRLDSLYLVGFRKQSDGQWLEFDRERAGATDKLIPGSTFLNFKGSYGAMESAGGGALSSATFKKEELVKGVRKLNDRNATKSERAQQLIVVIVFICESLRFTTISDFISDLFVIPNPVKKLSGRMTALINNWSKLSKLLVARERDPNNYFPLNPPPPEMEVVTYRDAVDVLGILNETSVRAFASINNAAVLTVTDDDREQYYPLGDPMVEVIWVKIDSRACDLYGTIQVIDGIGSQRLYQKPRDESAKTAPGELLLLSSPPDHSILAYDSFTINVDLKDAGNDIVNGQIFWNAYNTTSGAYDQPIQEVVKGEHGSTTVNYVVLSDAVKAQFEVILIKGGDDVYGDLNVRIANFEDPIVLFKKVAAATCVSRGNVIPLLKSAVAAPLNSFLVIEADISPDRGIAQGTAQFPTQLSGTSEKSIYGKSGEIRVKVTWTKET